MKNIVLCGFMGCGKTSVGKALAILLEEKFIDMDKYIENLAGQSVSEIFKNHGETYFRSLEAKVAQSISKTENLVVATGGGAVLSSKNVEAFKSSGLIVLIDVPLEVIASRLVGDETRPLLVGDDKENEMSSLYIKRMPIYRSVANFSVSNPDNRSELLIAHEIIEKATERL